MQEETREIAGYEPFMLLITNVLQEGEPETIYELSYEIGDNEATDQIFEELGMDCDGYTYQDIITLYLSEKAPDLMESVVDFDSEDATFVAYLDSEETLIQAAKTLVAFFQNQKEFKPFLKKYA